MLKKTNVTLSLSEELLKEARHLAVDENLSLSQFLATILEEHLMNHHRYREAERRQKERLHAARVLGTNGHPLWKREDLHER